MERYDYRKAMYEDIKEYIAENYETEEIVKDFMTKDEAFEHLYDEMWTADSVTGNASGSYTFNTWKAEEMLCHNLDLASEAYKEFGYESIPNMLIEGAEAIDVTIRCYLLTEILDEVLDDIYKEETENE